MDSRVKFMQEPDCWVGPNSLLADPEGFPDIAEDHFALTGRAAEELQALMDLRCQTDPLGPRAKNHFALKSPSKDFNDKQARLSAALDKSLHALHSDQDRLRADVQHLWRLNNVPSPHQIAVYDLSDVHYDHEEALRALQALNHRAATHAGPPGALGPMDLEEAGKSVDYKPRFVSKRMKTEQPENKGKAAGDLLSFED